MAPPLSLALLTLCLGRSSRPVLERSSTQDEAGLAYDFTPIYRWRFTRHPLISGGWKVNDPSASLIRGVSLVPPNAKVHVLRVTLLSAVLRMKLLALRLAGTVHVIAPSISIGFKYRVQQPFRLSLVYPEPHANVSAYSLKD
ncbi:hypothetical protein BJV74DRAFT_199397 [Russula compacta]|nr:hypothetical protein BJV74DRAFT_199397 [Russula compacta]